MCGILSSICSLFVLDYTMIIPKLLWSSEQKNQQSVSLMVMTKPGLKEGEGVTQVLKGRVYKETPCVWRAAGKSSYKIHRPCEVWMIQSLIWQLASHSLFFHRQKPPLHCWIKTQTCTSFRYLHNVPSNCSCTDVMVRNTLCSATGRNITELQSHRMLGARKDLQRPSSPSVRAGWFKEH